MIAARDVARDLHERERSQDKSINDRREYSRDVNFFRLPYVVPIQVGRWPESNALATTANQTKVVEQQQT